LIGGKAAACRRSGSGIPGDGFTFWLERNNGMLRWLLVIGRDKRLGIEHQFVLLIEFEFGFRLGGRGFPVGNLDGRRCRFTGTKFRRGWLGPGFDYFTGDFFGSASAFLGRRDLRGNFREGTELFFLSGGFHGNFEFGEGGHILGRDNGRGRGDWFLRDGKFLADDGFSGDFKDRRGLSRRCGNLFPHWCGRTGFREQRGPLVGKVYLVNFFLWGWDGLGGADFGVCGSLGGGWLRGNLRKIQFGGGFDRSLLARGSRCSGQIFVTETRSALKTAAQFAEAFGTTLIATLGVNLFELGGKFGGAAVVAGAEDEI
jgi:hypothetical protein